MRLSRFPLASLLDSASSHLEAHLLQKKESAPTSVAGSSAYAGIIFSGNPHEAVPRLLLLDDRLSPLERNAWQVFKLLINGDGVTAFPTYEQLRPYLGMQPGKPASRETISKALVTLRLTRWLSLGRRVRSDLSGQVQGNVYLLHDEPVSPAEAIELDKDYLQLLSQSMRHQNKSIRDVAEIAWNEFAADPDVGSRLPTRLDTFEARLSSTRWSSDHQASIPSEDSEFGIRTQPLSTSPEQSSESELSPNAGYTNHFPPSPDSEPSLKPGSTPLVRIPNSYSTYTNTNNLVCKSSVHVPHEINMSSEIHECLQRLPPDQHHNALEALQKVPADVKPALLSQWEHRLENGTIRNPLGYLLTLVTSAVRGDFNSDWVPDRMQKTTETAVQAPPERVDVPHEVTGDSSEALREPSATSGRSPEAIAAAQQQISSIMNQLRCRTPDAQ